MSKSEDTFCLILPSNGYCVSPVECEHGGPYDPDCIKHHKLIMYEGRELYWCSKHNDYAYDCMRAVAVYMEHHARDGMTALDRCCGLCGGKRMYTPAEDDEVPCFKSIHKIVDDTLLKMGLSL